MKTHASEERNQRKRDHTGGPTVSLEKRIEIGSTGRERGELFVSKNSVEFLERKESRKCGD